MDSRSSMPASGTSFASRTLSKRVAGTPYMSEQQTQAYLIARDVVRRVQRTSPLVSSILQTSSGTINRAQDHRYQNR